MRQILIENGTLNPDLTPNEETTAAMGWTLKMPQSGVDFDADAGRNWYTD